MIIVHTGINMPYIGNLESLKLLYLQRVITTVTIMPHPAHPHIHHHDEQKLKSLNAAFIIGIALNSAYVVIEAVFGLMYGSMGLLSDAGHNLSDVAALGIAMVAFKLMSKKPDSRHTYGYKKFTIQASFINALLLCVAVGAILVESVEKLFHPEEVDGDAIAWVAAAGVVVNGVTAWLFMKDKGRDMNVKAAFLHMAADTLVSIGVVISGIVIHFTGWYVLDPIIGIIIALIVALSMRGFLVESTRLSIDTVPESINMPELEQALESVDGVTSIHHLHVWPLSTTENALTVHVVISDVGQLDRIVAEAKRKAKEHGVNHATIEAETKVSPCHDSAMFNSD